MVSTTLNVSCGGLGVVSRQTLFALPADIVWNTGIDPYDVALDDQRFLMARDLGGEEVSDQDGPCYVLVLNFMEEVKKRVPPR